MKPSERLEKIEARHKFIIEKQHRYNFSHDIEDIEFLMNRVKRLTEALNDIIELRKLLPYPDFHHKCMATWAEKALEDET